MKQAHRVKKEKRAIPENVVKKVIRESAENAAFKGNED